MADLTTELLPILQLDEVVVLPGMTVTLAVETDSQRAAVEAAQGGNRLLLLVPRVNDSFAAI
ncbi:MAG TPA: LON peptidase substrate-binding domain-containing protein, partial [Candidatus Dormibacteraeota bacterium]|nr:LON peptidase substrate-binding domain-containing protein [Candidatus Dormibacteraeota bacterium]